MAYNLQPLITILQQILNPEQTRWVVDHNQPQLQSLLKKAASLQQILEKSSLPKNIESLEKQIRDAAHQAEDIIESQMVHQILSSPEGVSFTFSAPDLQQVMQQLDSVMEQVVKLAEEKTMASGSTSSNTSQLQDPSWKSIVVGVDEDLMQLKDRLTGTQSKLEIVPIVGMGGIGKTTLARKLYEDPSIVEHFSYIAWVTISQDYDMRAILLGLIRCIIGKECDQHNEKGSGELKDILYRSLYGRKCMIVLDDIWSTAFWDEIRMYFPDNNNRSRIVITTRESDVAKYVDSKSLQHQVQLLNKSEGWNLLRQIVFGEEDCPHDFQGIGEKIASDCGGLPLAINVIGGLLSKVQRLKDVWENIGNDVRAAIAESDQQFSNILSLSYNHLPLHLKPCFLYLGAFPEDYEIKTLRLIQMWVAEGFVKTNGEKSLEEEAEDYLKSLMQRNLLSVRRDKYGKPKRLSIHDLLRDLCIRKADDEKFLCVKNAPEVTFSNLRRVSFHTSYGMEYLHDEHASSEMSLARSFVIIGESNQILSPVVFTLSLLRVLDLMEMETSEFPREILQLVNLRYLAIDCYSLPSSGISRLCNLQTLIAMLLDFSVPSDLWEMSEIRHLQFIGIVKEDYTKKIVLKKLQTLWCVKLSPSMIRGGFLESIPSIKSLGLHDKEDSFLIEVVDLSHLHKLETLRWWSEDATFLRRLKFPSTLRKLSLIDCLINPGALTILCALPNLEVLKINFCTFKSEETNDEWEIAEEDEFSSLQFLQLYCLQLVRWRADETNFPRLRHLIIRRCYYLEEIPAGIGEIPTLQLIHLEDCSASAVASAKQIQEEQQSEYGNYDLQLRIS
ncbi:putative late blight resistance protein homolog R1A-10 [Salvia miltiorrhiza]|uniref:putative late blight resistance protein homolog R1A-10 n=1 Tax=Salvia miltiorrhiza TaxID=226208 RepID=UPI0025ACAEB0|nr:putative late blight resistance protein homolog R1A-10 [Salvia miltiorrhiza]XP_057772156.1 putative late blight resistance protein homolog R1A-10 [Salvia miltiorrhiza]XP_057772157.1 putative late blight resistance protein homolog R1A-10 [Salvia miltiorrhiza]